MKRLRFLHTRRDDDLLPHQKNTRLPTEFFSTSAMSDQMNPSTASLLTNEAQFLVMFHVSFQKEGESSLSRPGLLTAIVSHNVSAE